MNSDLNYEDLETNEISDHNGTTRKLERASYDGEDYWVKKGLSEREIDANLASEVVAEFSELSFPSIKYDGDHDALIIEDMGENSIPEVQEDFPYSDADDESIFLAAASKTLLGDRDMEKNVAYLHDGQRYQAFDTDNAGEQISITFERGFETIKNLANYSGRDLNEQRAREVFAKYLSTIAEDADLESIESELEGNEHQQQIVGNFEAACKYDSSDVEDPREHFLDLWSDESGNFTDAEVF